MDLVYGHLAGAIQVASLSAEPELNRPGPLSALRVVRPMRRQKGLTGWGYLPGQWRLANVAYPHFLSEGRVNDGGVGGGPGQPV